MNAKPHRRRLITLLGASAGAAALPTRAIGAARSIDARIFVPAVESAIPLDLTVPGRFIRFAGILDLMRVPTSADVEDTLAAEASRHARLMLADEVDPHPPTPPASPGSDA